VGGGVEWEVGGGRRGEWGEGVRGRKETKRA